MSTDESMDALLRQAGARWRATHTEPAAVDLTELTETVPITPSAPERGRRRRLRVWLAATVGMAAAVAVTVVVSQLHDRPRPTPEGAPAALVGTDWRLQAMRAADGTALRLAVPAPLSFDRKRISGTDGCNHFGATVTIRADRIVLGDLATTEVACLNPSPYFAGQVNLIHAVLSGTVQWSVNGDRLTLIKPRVGTLVYSLVHHETTTDPKALVGPTWRLTTIERGGPNGVASTPAAPAHVRFRSPGSFDGFDGCNQIGGKAVTGSGTMSGLGLGGTTTACPGAVGEQERMFFDVLSGTVTWSIKDGVLTITQARVGSLVFNRT